MRGDLIMQSLEQAAAHGGDLAPLVYSRLFAERPELAALFRENPKLVLGEMLAKTFEVILDFVDGDAFASNMIASEATTHTTYDVPRETFAIFFRVIAEVLRDQLGREWTDETNGAWLELVGALSSLAAAEGATA